MKLERYVRLGWRARLKQWLRRIRNRLKWWWCSRTTGHTWGSILVYQVPVMFDDVETVGASTRCLKCNLILDVRESLTKKMICSANADVYQVVQGGLVNSILRATAGAAVPVYHDFNDWMLDYHYRRNH